MSLLHGTRRGLFIRSCPLPPPSDWWMAAGTTPWGAYQPKGAASFAASLLDLSGNGNNAGDPGGAATPDWDAVNGWKFNGATDYLTTTFVPAIDQSQTMIVQFTNVTSTDNVLSGSHSGAGSILRIKPNHGTTSVRYSNGQDATVAPVLLAGNLAVAGSSGYRNGAAEGGVIGPWAGAATEIVIIGGMNLVGTGPTAFIAAYVQSYALSDCTLTAPQVAAVAAAMAAL